MPYYRAFKFLEERGVAPLEKLPLPFETKNTFLSAVAHSRSTHHENRWCPTVTRDEFRVHGVPRCLDDQGDKHQGVGLSGARVESLPRKVTISPREPVFLGREPSGTGAFQKLHRFPSVISRSWQKTPEVCGRPGGCLRRRRAESKRPTESF